MNLPLVEGGFATVDDANYDLLKHFRWHKCGFCQHIFRTVKRYREGDYTIYLAAEVMGSPLMEVRGACNPCPAIRD
jgi:hypothetical protein